MENTITKKKYLVTLSSNGLDGSVEVLDFLKRTRELEPSAAIAMVLKEWYELHAKGAVAVKPAEEVPIIGPDD
jgi:hypothetical protein